MINRAAATMCKWMAGGAGFGSLAGRECSAFSSELILEYLLHGLLIYVYHTATHLLIEHIS